MLTTDASQGINIFELCGLSGVGFYLISIGNISCENCYKLTSLDFVVKTGTGTINYQEAIFRDRYWHCLCDLLNGH